MINYEFFKKNIKNENWRNNKREKKFQILLLAQWIGNLGKTFYFHFFFSWLEIIAKQYINHNIRSVNSINFSVQDNQNNKLDYCFSIF